MLLTNGQNQWEFSRRIGYSGQSHKVFTKIKKKFIFFRTTFLCNMFCELCKVIFSLHIFWYGNGPHAFWLIVENRHDQIDLLWFFSIHCSDDFNHLYSYFSIIQTISSSFGLHEEFFFPYLYNETILLSYFSIIQTICSSFGLHEEFFFPYLYYETLLLLNVFILVAEAVV